MKKMCCVCGGKSEKAKNKGQMTDKTSQTVSTSHQLSTQSVVDIQNMEDIESNKTTVLLESPTHSKMMKNILTMKQKLRNERQNNQIEPEPKEETVQWYHLPEHLLSED